MQFAGVDPHPRAGMQQGLDLAQRDLAAAHHQHLATGQVGKHRVERHRGSLGNRRRLRLCCRAT
jgi:hypothetical protein